MHPMFQALSSHRWTPVAPLDEADLDCKDVGQEIETLGWGLALHSALAVRGDDPLGDLRGGHDVTAGTCDY